MSNLVWWPLIVLAAVPFVTAESLAQRGAFEHAKGILGNAVLKRVTASAVLPAECQLFFEGYLSESRLAKSIFLERSKSMSNEFRDTGQLIKYVDKRFKSTYSMANGSEGTCEAFHTGPHPGFLEDAEIDCEATENICGNGEACLSWIIPCCEPVKAFCALEVQGGRWDTRLDCFRAHSTSASQVCSYTCNAPCSKEGTPTPPPTPPPTLQPTPQSTKSSLIPTEMSSSPSVLVTTSESTPLTESQAVESTTVPFPATGGAQSRDIVKPTIIAAALGSVVATVGVLLLCISKRRSGANPSEPDDSFDPFDPAIEEDSEISCWATDDSAIIGPNLRYILDEYISSVAKSSPSVAIPPRRLRKNVSFEGYDRGLSSPQAAFGETSSSNPGVPPTFEPEQLEQTKSCDAKYLHLTSSASSDFYRTYSTNRASHSIYSGQLSAASSMSHATAATTTHVLGLFEPLGEAVSLSERRNMEDDAAFATPRLGRDSISAIAPDRSCESYATLERQEFVSGQPQASHGKSTATPFKLVVLPGTVRAATNTHPERRNDEQIRSRSAERSSNDMRRQRYTGGKVSLRLSTMKEQQQPSSSFSRCVAKEVRLAVPIPSLEPHESLERVSKSQSQNCYENQYSTEL